MSVVDLDKFKVTLCPYCLHKVNYSPTMGDYTCKYCGETYSPEKLLYLIDDKQIKERIKVYKFVLKHGRTIENYLKEKK